MNGESLASKHTHLIISQAPFLQNPVYIFRVARPPLLRDHTIQWLLYTIFTLYFFSVFPSCRANLVFVCFLGCVNVYALRVNLSVALVAMVNSSYSNPRNNSNNDCSMAILPYGNAHKVGDDVMIWRTLHYCSPLWRSHHETVNVHQSAFNTHFVVAFLLVWNIIYILSLKLTHSMQHPLWLIVMNYVSVHRKC